MIKNTTVTYGSLAKWFHWLTALWILAAYISIYYLEWALGGEGPLRSSLIRVHKAIGFSVLAFFVLRLFWRATNPSPALPHSMPKWQVNASHVSHFLLYFFLIAMPISGYVGNGSGVDYGLFKIAAFKHSGMGIWILDVLGLTFEQWEKPFDFFHYRIAGPFLLSTLIVVHAGAALYHHYVEKDDVLKRMLPSKP
jgi:cytochrome b561